MSMIALVNARIRGQDRAVSPASAILIEGTRIRALGSDAEIRSALPRGTEVLDLGGRLVLPGLTDAHAHFLSWALLRSRLPLSDVSSLGEALRRVGEKARLLREGDWILGWGLDESAWPEARLPTKEELEAAAPRNPVFIRRRDGHLAVVNSLALRLAEIGPWTPDPKGGGIDRGSGGAPIGILRERAVDLVERVIPEPSDEEGARAVEEAFPELHRLGLTGIYDYRLPGSSEGAMAARIFRHVRSKDGFKVRCCMTISGVDPEASAAAGLVPGSGDEKFRVGHLKYFLDGSLGSQTAWMFEPYSDGHQGMPVCSLPELEERIAAADARGWPVAVHAIGDRAVHELVGIFERVAARRRGGGFPGLVLPHRIEHVQMIRPDDIARLAGLGVVASVQPLHATDDMKMNDRWVGPASRFAYPFKELFDAGINVVFGSDSPVSDLNPFWGIHAAVTRRRRDGDPPDGWFPEQRIGVEEAVRGYTSNFAASMGLSGQMGALAPGKLADLVALDRDIYSVDPMEIHRATVDLTLFDGEVVYRKGL